MKKVTTPKIFIVIPAMINPVIVPYLKAAGYRRPINNEMIKNPRRKVNIFFPSNISATLPPVIDTAI